MTLTKYEKETIWLTNEADDYYSVYTFNGKLKKKLADFATSFPDDCRKVSATDEGSATFEIRKARVSIRLIPPYSEERRKAASDRAKKSTLIVSAQS
ncbi:MAG: molecular chaperone [Dorea sp.]|nr:molecular chaperone [Dorea sp.]